MPHPIAIRPRLKFTQRLDDQVTTRRKCVVCCIQAQSNYRDYLVEFLINANNEIVRTLQAGIIPLAPAIRFPVSVRLPLPRPFFKPDVDDLVAPSSLGLALAQVDTEGIGRVIDIISKLKNPTDCEGCCEPLRQTNRALKTEFRFTGPNPARIQKKGLTQSGSKRINPRKLGIE